MVCPILLLKAGLKVQSLTCWQKVKMAWSPSARIILCLMVFWGQIQNYMMRVNLSILIVAMVKTGLFMFFLHSAVCLHKGPDDLKVN